MCHSTWQASRHRKTWARTRGVVKPVVDRLVDRPDVQIDGLQAAEGALDAGEALVGADHAVGGQDFVLDIGADDIEAVEPRLGGDPVGVAGEGEAVFANGDVEQLGELVAVLDAADGAGDLVLAPCGRCRGRAARPAYPMPLRSPAADPRALRARSSANSGFLQTTSRSPGNSGGSDLGQVTLPGLRRGRLEQRELEGAGIE